MEDLFSSFPLKTEGLQYYPDFISDEEEAALIKEIQQHPLKTFMFHGFAAKRKVLSFGYSYDFETKLLVPVRPIPEVFNDLIERISTITKDAPSAFKNVLITAYESGAVINWHRDAPPFEKVLGLSLLSDCDFKFRPHAKEQQGRGQIKTVRLQRKSLYVLQGKVREEWEHSTAAQTQRRYSLTFRTLRIKSS